MTHEEAIEVLQKDIRCSKYIGGDCLKGCGENCENYYNEADFVESVAMAIEALEKVKKSEETFEWCTDCKEYDHEHYRCNRWNKRIRDTVEELRGSTMWIPCEDMLPEIGQQVLCCNDDGKVFTSCMNINKAAFDGTYVFGQHWGVIAWMPLPKPYKESDLE